MWFYKSKDLVSVPLRTNRLVKKLKEFYLDLNNYTWFEDDNRSC